MCLGRRLHLGIKPLGPNQLANRHPSCHMPPLPPLIANRHPTSSLAVCLPTGTCSSPLAYAAPSPTGALLANNALSSTGSPHRCLLFIAANSSSRSARPRRHGQLFINLQRPTAHDDDSERYCIPLRPDRRPPHHGQLFVVNLIVARPLDGISPGCRPQCFHVPQCSNPPSVVRPCTEPSVVGPCTEPRLQASVLPCASMEQPLR